MYVRLLFNREYPEDFTEAEKKIVGKFLTEIPNDFCKEYEFDSEKLNVFIFYKLLVSLGFSDIKMECVSGKRVFTKIDMFKVPVIEDVIVFEFTDFQSFQEQIKSFSGEVDFC